MVLVAGKMYRPTDIAVNTTTNAAYVVEQFNHRISKWDYTPGSFTFTLDGTWGSNGDGTSGIGAPIGDGGSTDNSLYYPTGIVYDGSRLVVTDTFHNRIRTLSHQTGEWNDSTGQGGSGVADFYHPTGIGHSVVTLVIADEGNHRSVKYIVGDPPTLPAVLDEPTPLPYNRPHGVTFESIGSFFNITDTSRGVISRYNSVAAIFIDQNGAPGTTGTDLFFPASGHGTLTGNSSNLFADTRNNDIKTINASTLGLTTGTIAGTGNGQLNYPESVNGFLDTANYVLVANTLNNRVEVYSNTTNALSFESSFGSP
jgi:hypothetical protein